MGSPNLLKLQKTIQDCPANKSITKKYLTNDIAQKYLNIKTSFGGTLAHCVTHNSKNPTALLPRCADVECYTVFADFFDAVIRDYHKVTAPEIAHPSSNFGDLDNLPFGELGGKNDLIVSTRVRLGRTVKGYGFAPVITEVDRISLEKKIVAALTELTDDYAGTYYPLEGMKDEDYKSLVNQHFLFRNDDSILRDAGGYRDWPSGRGIFINHKKTFLVWVNEEDHIRIISMQPGGNLAEVYKRLADAVNQISKRIEFEKSDRFGFLTFCPSNLGTTLRASVHAKIPLVSSLPNFKDICEKYHLQSRGTGGEHTATVDGVFDLSNKRRLGLTEIEAVTEMAQGVEAILSLEKMMKEYNMNLPSTTTPIEPLRYLTKMILDAEDSRCLLKNYLTEEKIEFFDGKHTSLGTTLGHMLRQNAYNPGAFSIYIGDAECYELFNEPIDYIVCDYHKVTSDKVTHPSPDFGDITKLPFGDIDPEGKFIISTRVRVGRSVEGYQFGPTINQSARIELESKIASVLRGLTGELAGTYYDLVSMKSADQKRLIEDHFLFKDDDNLLRDAGGYRDWPAGRGIFHNKDKTFLCWIGEEDHLRIISMQKGGDLAKVYTRLISGIRAIESVVKFSHSNKYGYLTCCPTNLGTTMRASVHMKVPKLSAKKEMFDEICSKYGIQARGIHGEHTDSVGGVYDLSNKRRLGLTELEAASEMAKGIEEIIKVESSL